jgi:hypothetical protein
LNFLQMVRKPMAISLARALKMEEQSVTGRKRQPDSASRLLA